MERRDCSGSSSDGASFVSESNRVLGAIDDTERGVGHNWKNVQPAVVQSTRQLHQAVQHLMHRMDSMESKLDQVLVAVATLTQDRAVKEERYASDNRAFDRAWSQLQDNVNDLRADFERSTVSHTESSRLLRDVTIPALERQLIAAREELRLQAFDAQRIEDLERATTDLRRTKTDDDRFSALKLQLESKLEQMQLFPAFKSGVGAADSKGTPATSSWSDGVVSLSRWVWHRGTVADTVRSPAIRWQRIVRVGEAMIWSSSHPEVVKVVREGVYRMTVAIFHNGKGANVPSLSIFVNNDPVMHALSSSSTCVLRRGHNDEPKYGAACRRCRRERCCCCDGQPLNGLSLQDMLYLPAGSIVTVAYKGDVTNVMSGLLELQCLV